MNTILGYNSGLKHMQSYALLCTTYRCDACSMGGLITASQDAHEAPSGAHKTQAWQAACTCKPTLCSD